MMISALGCCIFPEPLPTIPMVTIIVTKKEIQMHLKNTFEVYLKYNYQFLMNSEYI